MLSYHLHNLDESSERLNMKFFSSILAAVPCCSALRLSCGLDRRSFAKQAAWIGTGALSSLISSPLVAASAASSPPLVPPLSERFETSMLKQPPAQSAAGDLTSSGIDNTYFPDFMAGTWRVTQTLVEATAPLGLPYIGGPNGDLKIAETSMDETRSKLYQPVSLQLRFVRTKWGVAEDRLYNNAQRLNTFAGRKVVATVDYADVGASNRASFLKNGGTADDPLATVLVRYRGPAAQKVFVTSHSATSRTQSGDTTTTPWFISEGQRSIFALTNENTAPPIFTDSEVLWKLHQVDAKHVQARLRLAGYLNAQSDKLFFDARNRAVSLLEYTLDMEQISST